MNSLLCILNLLNLSINVSTPSLTLEVGVFAGIACSEILRESLWFAYKHVAKNMLNVQYLKVNIRNFKISEITKSPKIFSIHPTRSVLVKISYNVNRTVAAISGELSAPPDFRDTSIVCPLPPQLLYFISIGTLHSNKRDQSPHISNISLPQPFYWCLLIVLSLQCLPLVPHFHKYSLSPWINLLI